MHQHCLFTCLGVGLEMFELGWWPMMVASQKECARSQTQIVFRQKGLAAEGVALKIRRTPAEPGVSRMCHHSTESEDSGRKPAETSTKRNSDQQRPAQN